MRKFDGKTSKAKSKGRPKGKAAKAIDNSKAKVTDVTHLANRKTSADRLLKAQGGRGVDPRSNVRQENTPEKQEWVLPNSDPTFGQPIGVDQRSLEYLAMGITLRAIKRGFGAGRSDPEFVPYYAWRFLIDIFVNVVKGQFNPASQLPKWMWELCSALKPKVETIKTGRIEYSANIIGSPATVPLFTIGTSPEAVNVFWGLVNPVGAVIDELSVLAEPSAPYDQVLGAAALKSLWESFPLGGLNELTADPGESKFFSHDTSSTAASYAEIGTSVDSAGGIANSVLCERFIEAPMLSQFTRYQAFEFEWRSWNAYRRTSGSATYIGPRCTELASPIDMHNKIAPIFKFYNFDEFVEQAALILCRAQENYYADTTSVDADAYPLSSQMFQIILRQSLVYQFCNEMAQDLRFSSASTDGALPTMLPLCVGPNGVSRVTTIGSMKMPRFFVESVRACGRLTARLSTNRPIKGRFQAPPVLDLVPVLCRYQGQPQLQNYLWTNPRTGDETPLFAGPGGETAIDLINASVTVGPDTFYLDLNGVKVSQWVELHNSWMSKRTSVMTGLCDLSNAEKGIPALNANVMTLHLRTVAPPESPPIVNSPQTTTTTTKVLEKKDSKKILRRDSKGVLVGKYGVTRDIYTKFTAVPDAPSSYMRNTIGMTSVSTSMPPDPATWKYKNIMIKPVFTANFPAEWGGDNLYSGNQWEYYTVNLSSVIPQFQAGDGQAALPYLYDMHLSAANMDVKTKGSDASSEMETDFDTMAASGHGGFFTSIGKIIGGALDAL